MTGATIAQAIPIIISPILTRIYTPEDFGLFALYMSFASLIALSATGRYELAIMLPRKEEDAANIVYLSIVITIFISLITLVVIFLFNKQIANLLGDDNLSKLLFLVPITVLLTGTYQTFNYWSIRKEQYRLLATNRVIQSTVAATSNLSIGLSGLTTNGLIVSSIIGQAISTSVLVKKVWKKDSSTIKKAKKIKIIALLRKYKKLPIFNLPNALIDGIRLSGINILIAKFFATATLGQFSLAWKMVQLPISLISGSLSQVFFQKLSKLEHKKLYSFILKYIFKASLISSPLFLIIYYFSENIFIIAFGEKWEVAGKIASILSPWVFLNFITSPLSRVFIILNIQEKLLIFSIIYMMTPLLILYIFKNEDFLTVISYISVAMSTFLLLFLAMVLVYTKKNHL